MPKFFSLVQGKFRDDPLDKPANIAPLFLTLAESHVELFPGGDTVIQRGHQFIPLEPETLDEAGLNESFVEALILKLLLSCGDTAGRGIAEQIRLPYVLLEPLLRRMKQDVAQAQSLDDLKKKLAFKNWQ